MNLAMYSSISPLLVPCMVLTYFSDSVVCSPLIGEYFSAWQNILLDDSQKSFGGTVRDSNEESLLGSTVVTFENPLFGYNPPSVVFAFRKQRFINLDSAPRSSEFAGITHKVLHAYIPAKLVPVDDCSFAADLQFCSNVVIRVSSRGTGCFGPFDAEPKDLPQL